MYRVESSEPALNRGFLKSERPDWSFVKRFKSYPDAVKYVHSNTSKDQRFRIVSERADEYSILDN